MGGHRPLHKGPTGAMPKGAPASNSKQPMASPGKAGGAISFKAPKDLKAFGHDIPKIQPLTTDRGAFKIKG